MSEDSGDTPTVDPDTVGIRCESYPNECQFAMQVGMFETTADGDQFLPTMQASDTCPTCGGGLEEWDPSFESSAPGRPIEW